MMRVDSIRGPSAALRRVVVLSVALVVGACASLGAAPTSPGERPSFVHGDRWRYVRPSGELLARYVYQGVLGELPLFRRTDYTPWTDAWTALQYYFPPREFVVGPDFAPFIRDGHPWCTQGGGLRFPLVIGKSWSHAYAACDNHWRQTTHRVVHATVQAYERVTVRAGSFGAFRIETVDSPFGYIPNEIYARHETYWYAPAAKTVVKYQRVRFYADLGQRYAFTIDPGWARSFPGYDGPAADAYELAEYEIKR